jgi:glucan biosynthesis protein C
MSRFHALDACRAGAMLWGLLFHAAVSFMTIPIGWAVQDPARSRGVDAFVWISHSFRMPVFFLMAGFFARLLWRREGAAGFLRHRAKRLLLPMVVALVPVMPAVLCLWIWGRSKQPGLASHPLGIPVGELDLADLRPSPCHLWFLYYLMMLCVLLAAVVAAAERLPLDRLKRAGDALFRGALRLHLLPLLIALPTAGTLSLMKGLDAETPVDFVPQPRILLFYAVFLALGWWLHRQPELVPALGRRLWIPALAAIVVLPLLGRAVEAQVSGAGSGSRGEALALSGLFCGCTVSLFLGLFVRFAESPRPWIAWISDASYWSYLLHLPVTVALQIWVVDKAWPGPLKYAVVLGGTLVVCFGTYRLFVRHTWIGAALNGKRLPRPA